MVSSLTNERWLIDATPDFADQLRLLDTIHPIEHSPLPVSATLAKHIGLTGILLTSSSRPGRSRTEDRNQRRILPCCTRIGVPYI